MDLITRDRICTPEEPRWYMPKGVSGWEPERTVFTSMDDEKIAENREAWEAAQFQAHRGSTIPMSDEDEEHGHAVDDTVVVSSDDHTETFAYSMRRSDVEVERERREVATLYARLALGRLPWMHRTTYRWFMDLQRHDALKRRQRTAIIGLLRKLGRDPKSPAVVAWVTENGYDAALAKLSAATQRQGVLA